MTDLAARLGGLTDKFSLGYYPAYAGLAARAGPSGHVLEAGVGAGGSLLMWQALFPDGLVAGADHDAGCTWPDGTVRIVAGQDTAELAELAAAASPEGWDLIVDDASHDGGRSGAMFRLLWPQVKPGRWYVLEDWAVGYLPQWRGTFGESMLRLAESFLQMMGPGSDVAEVRYRFSQAIICKTLEAP